MLNKYYVGEMPCTNSLLSLPPPDFAIKNLMAKYIEEVMVPDMWLRPIGFPGKSGIVCVFEVFECFCKTKLINVFQCKTEEREKLKELKTAFLEVTKI